MIGPRCGNHSDTGRGRIVTFEIPPLISMPVSCELPETTRDRTALKVALRKHQDKARTYFDELAGKFGRSYVPGPSWHALANTLISLLPAQTVADLGASEGTLSQSLSRTAKKVIAIDNSPKMVEFGAKLASDHGFKNVEYRLGDLEEPPIEKGSIDLAILSQALHHAVQAAHRILRKGGRLATIDLLSHRSRTLRRHWLGFSEVQLHQWLEAAGFRKIEVTVVCISRRFSRAG